MSFTLSVCVCVCMCMGGGHVLVFVNKLTFSEPVDIYKWTGLNKRGANSLTSKWSL